MKELTTKDLLLELRNRGLLTSAKYHDELIEQVEEGLCEGVEIILTRGKPVKQQQCSRCRNDYDSSMFNYYQARVSSDGYLSRSNAVCKVCSKAHGKELKDAINKCGGKRPPKPKSGDTCLNCERPWSGNWHLHHRHDKIIGYICGHCNMSFSDHRNEEVIQKRNLQSEYFLDDIIKT